MFAPIVKLTRIGTREFLRAGCYVIPVDRIREIDFAPDKGSGCDVIILADDGSNTRRSYGYSGELARQIGEFLDASAEEPMTYPRDYVTPDILDDIPVGVKDGPVPAGFVEQVERIIEILHDSRFRGHGARSEDATEALQELRRRLIKET